jgi:hypothetical protein
MNDNGPLYVVSCCVESGVPPSHSAGEHLVSNSFIRVMSEGNMNLGQDSSAAVSSSSLGDRRNYVIVRKHRGRPKPPLNHSHHMIKSLQFSSTDLNEQGKYGIYMKCHENIFALVLQLFALSLSVNAWIL